MMAPESRQARRAMTCIDEDTILAFVEGRLGSGAIAAVEAHTRGCSDCRDLLSAAVAVAAPGRPGEGSVSASDERAAPQPGATAAPLAKGTSIGRYVVLGLIGRGGMGEVYAAYDPELDRKIALKLLHTEGEALGARGRGRLLREAKAIARLSHPNVVVVHDGGTYEERVFVAMEFIDGQTLAAWSSQRSRSRAEILAVFAAAARGLGAAHAAGLVHRDFKPQNVMVGGDGAVRVTDFGLARLIDEVPVAGDALVANPAGPVFASLDFTLTRTGELLGTPLYMAPEQYGAGRADAKTDQFSFCVALYQALYGAHPFRTDTLGTLMADVLGGRVLPPPPKSTVPAWLRRVLLRGLSVDPDARWPSMDAVLAALGRDPTRTRRRWAIGAGAVAVILVGALGLVRLGGERQRLCGAGSERLAGAWDAGAGGPRHDAARSAFLRTGLPYAEETWDRVSRLLDRYVAGWLAQYRDTCEATHVRGEQSADVLDLRMTCLTQHLSGIRALADVYSSADRETVDNAVNAASALPPLDRCADVNLLRAPVEPPRDQATRARSEELLNRVATAEALNNTGKHQRAMAEARRLATEARALGYRPLLAELLGRVGSLEAGTNGATLEPEAEGDLEESVRLALSSRRDDVAAESAAQLAGVEGLLARYDQGERWALLADAELDRLGEGHDRVRSWVLQNRSTIREGTGDIDGALAFIKGAIALKEKTLPPDSPDMAASLTWEAWLLHRRGDDRAALAINDRGQDMVARAYGAGSPSIAVILNNRGEYLVALARLDEAIAAYRGALARFEPQLGPEHHFLGHPLTGLGLAHLAADRPAEALPPLERALRLREAHEPDPILVADTRFALGRALWSAGADRSRARRLAEQARDAYLRDGARAASAAEVSTWLRAHEPK
jgi:eukaryotic-like serine/threonine-protein kinase